MVAGEPSGDQLGADLIIALRAQCPSVEITALAGPKMCDAGCVALASIEELSVMGIVEVLRHYPRLRRLRSRITQHFLANPPDIFVGIDVPDFVLSIETRLKRAKIPTLHYVCPQVWAWRQSRVAEISRAADGVLALFPFEVPFLRKHHVSATFVGHPLADRIPLEVDRRASRVRLGVPDAGPLIAMMPGSRRQEFSRHIPLFLATAQVLATTIPTAQFLIGVMNVAAGDTLTQQCAQLAPTLPIHVVVRQSQEALMAADAALCVSGTITLEAALTKTPLVVAYQMPWLTYELLRRVVKIPRIALPNILIGRELVPEFVQNAATPERLAGALMQWLGAADSVQAYRAECLELHYALRNNAGAAAAAAILKFVRTGHAAEA